MDPAAGGKPINQLAAARNIQLAAVVRTLLAVVTGSAVGILGLKGGPGFAVYAAQHLLVSAALLQRAKWRPADVFPGEPSVAGTVAGTALEQVLTYVLCWTLAYALVHIY